VSAASADARADAERRSSSAPRHVPRALLAVAAAWLVAGLVGGVAAHLTVLGPRGQPLAATLRGPLLASAIWIPLTFAIGAAARRWPAWPPVPRRVLLHLALAGATSFVLNLLWTPADRLLSGGSMAPEALLRAGLRAGLLYIHMNAGVYLAIVAFVTLWLKRPEETGAEGAPPRGTPGGGRADAGAGATPAPADTLAVKIGSRTRVIPVADIVWIEGAGDYARVHLDGTSSLANERLKDLEARLDPATFARVHRSAIVNLTRIRELQHRSHGDYDAFLDDGTVVKVSRSRRGAIEPLLRGIAGGTDPGTPA
jgi:two-component system LytT family response regulator